MSYTTLYKVPASGPIETYKDYHNAFRSAWLVWDTMSKQYLGKDAVEFMLDRSEHAMQPVWDLWKDPNVPESHRIVMASTFDKVMVKRENLERLGEAYDAYSRAVEDPGHIEAMADDLRELAQDETCFAVCWCQTSVSSDVWLAPVTCECCGSEVDYRMYDVSRDEGHWFLFEARDELSMEKT